MAFYKFLGREFVGRVVDGSSLKFGRLDYYRLLEVVKLNRHIGDVNEGRSVTKLSYATSDTMPANIAKALAPYVQTEGSASAVINGLVVHEAVDAFIFSFSEGDFEHLFPVMCQNEDASLNYDGCVEIDSPEAFIDAIVETGTCGGKLLRDMFRIEMGQCTYTDVGDYDLLETEKIVPANPYRKDRFYAGQQEWRVVLYPLSPLQGDSVFIRFSPRNIISPISLPPVKTESGDRPVADAEAKLGKLIVLWEALNQDRGHLDFHGWTNLKDPEVWKKIADISEACSKHTREVEDNWWKMHSSDVLSAYWEVRKYRPSSRVDRRIIYSYYEASFIMRNIAREYHDLK